MRAKRHRTAVRGVLRIEEPDGTESFVATWREPRAFSITDPRSVRRRRVERPAASFEDACRLVREAEELALVGAPRRDASTEQAERMAALNWLQHWVRR